MIQKNSRFLRKYKIIYLKKKLRYNKEGLFVNKQNNTYEGYIYEFKIKKWRI